MAVLFSGFAMPPTPFAVILDLACTGLEEILIILYDQGDICSGDAPSLPDCLTVEVLLRSQRIPAGFFCNR